MAQLVKEKGFVVNNQVGSYKFGADAVRDFCNMHNLDMIVRAHQVVKEGYEYFADDRLITVFSAPRYWNRCDNAAAMVIVDANLTCSFKQLTKDVPILKPPLTSHECPPVRGLFQRMMSKVTNDFASCRSSLYKCVLCD